jgi:transcriptional regulator with XRE-family HTH domain
VGSAGFLYRTEGRLGTSSVSVGSVFTIGEAGSLNEILRRALFRARLAEEDVAAQLGVDPKTVRRWLEGRLPYPRHRWALSALLGADEGDLWPELHAARAARSRPAEIKAVYPHRWAVPHEVWRDLFASAHREVDLLAYSALFIAEDAELLDILASKARAGVKVKITLGDPSSPHVAERGTEEGIGDAMPAKVKNALMLFRPLLGVGNVEIRLHQATLYNSFYRADDDLLVNQHVYGIPAVNAPVLHLRRVGDRRMFDSYVESLEHLQSSAVVLT